MEQPCKTQEHGCRCTIQTAAQSLDEMEFERGIWSAAQCGNSEKVRQLVQSGKCGIDQRDSAGYTALHYAARNGHLDICRYLVKNGADVNNVTRAGRATALHRAASAGKSSVVSFLLSTKANGTLQDSDGKTALHRACEGGNKDIYKLIASQFPHLRNVTDNKGNTPTVFPG
ncbi:ankyrin repeat domain-containing protein 39-like [Euwallacea similis]|uniref:ankyrin repeat domain-containing protein 39-like n=1 Tax=Euwallacea similis TaxID=1736056 RepID=UPI00344E5008